jgi:transposase
MQKAEQKAVRAPRSLTLVRGKWYLAIVCDVPDPDKVGIEDILAVDLGVVNLPLTALRPSV